MRILSCPKKLLNGPCGDVFNGTCRVSKKPCPWVYVLEKLDTLDGAPLLVEHPIVARFTLEDDVEIKKSKFIKDLEKGRAISVEFPIRVFESGFKDFKDNGYLFTVPDNPLGYPHVSSVALATWLKSKGFEVMPHVTGKDRNALAITSELRTAVEFNFEGVLLTTGDWPGLMLHAKPVFDLDSTNMIKLARLVFSGILPTGEKIEVKERPFVAGTMNPNYQEKLEGKRLARKIIAGVDVVFTQVVANVKVARKIPEIVKHSLKYSSREVPIVVSLLYPIKKELENALRSMGVEVGSKFEEVLEEVSSLEFAGINLIVFADDWMEKLKKL